MTVGLNCDFFLHLKWSESSPVFECFFMCGNLNSSSVLSLIAFKLLHKYSNYAYLQCLNSELAANAFYDFGSNCCHK